MGKALFFFLSALSIISICKSFIACEALLHIISINSVVQILVHSHFDLLGLATRTVAQMTIQMISSGGWHLVYFKRDRDKGAVLFQVTHLFKTF